MNTVRYRSAVADPPQIPPDCGYLLDFIAGTTPEDRVSDECDRLARDILHTLYYDLDWHPPYTIVSVETIVQMVVRSLQAAEETRAIRAHDLTSWLRLRHD